MGFAATDEAALLLLVAVISMLFGLGYDGGLFFRMFFLAIVVIREAASRLLFPSPAEVKKPLPADVKNPRGEWTEAGRLDSDYVGEASV